MTKVFNLPKFEICASELEFLGQVMDASGIRPSPKHTAAVRDYPAPWSKEENSRFLSLSSGHFCPMPPYCSSLAAYKPDEEKCSVLLGKGSTKIVQASKKCSPQSHHSSASIPICSGPTKYRCQGQPHQSRFDAAGKLGSDLGPHLFYSKGLNSGQRKYWTYDREKVLSLT